MEGLEGTVKTPLGTVSKKTALIAVGGLVLIGGIVWWRAKQTKNQQDALSAGQAEINPATGYPYGSAEDAAALAAQNSFISPGGGGVGSGAGGYPPAGIGYVNNAQWVQGVIEYMVSHNLVEEPSALSAALGVYITGGVATAAQRSLIEQAIAAQGYPPLAGPSGYPPSINTAPVVNPPVTTPPPPATTPPPVTTPPGPTVPVGYRISVPLGYNLYEWTKQVAAGYHVPYSFEIMEQLNPNVRQYIVWLGNVSPKTPVFRPSGGVPPMRIR